MPIVIYSAHKDGHHDGSISKQTMAFIRKLFEDDTRPGLHIEPIKNAVDPRVRTGRVNDMYRAVLFKVQPPGGQPHYVFTGVWPHDEAIEIAGKATLTTNPVNGLTELTIAPTTATLGAAVKPDVSETPTDGDRTTYPLLESVSPGITFVRLTDELGLDSTLSELAMRAVTDDELMDLAAGAVKWQGDALLELAVGQSIEQVRDSLRLDEVAVVATDATEDERLLAGLRSPTARRQFAWLEDDEELRRVIETGDFADWRVFLHPTQRRYADGSWKGPFRLSGGAGTGKTVVLLHRARHLAQRNPQARVVLTTFTRNLADAMRADLALLDETLTLADELGQPGVFVTGVDAAASKVLASADPARVAETTAAVLGVPGNRATRRNANAQASWREAIANVGDALPVELRTPMFFEAEYAAVILAGRITSREEYLRVRRPGRGVALGRAQRGAVWDVVSSYRRAAALESTVDFGEVCAIAAELCNAGAVRLADHVLVDEGQDLTPAQWRFLRSLVDEGTDDLFIAEDAQQRIYGQRVVLGRHGIRIVGRSRRLSLNYRTTQQVLGFAASVLAGSEFVDLDDEVTDDSGYRSARSGPSPTRIGAPSLTAELDRAAEEVGGWLESGVEPAAIAVLVRDQRTADIVTRGFDERGVTVRQVGRGSGPAKHPQLMTMHRAKGMEFSRVLIFGADQGIVPAAYLLRQAPEGDHADLLQRERSLFYVAATRARDELTVMWEGRASEFVVDGSARPS